MKIKTKIPMEKMPPEGKLVLPEQINAVRCSKLIECKCKDVKMGSYSNQTSYMYNGKMIGVDNCILDEIKYLQSLDITTIESCCGHNITHGYIVVDIEDSDKMKEMGYIPESKDNIFYPKSVKLLIYCI